MAVGETGMALARHKLLAAVLAVLNAHLPAGHVDGSSPVFPGDTRLNLGRVSFKSWIDSLMPKHAPRRKKVLGVDLMTRQHYPRTAAEKTALRTFGPYGKRTDPGDRAIFELPSLMNNPVADLHDLVKALTLLMRSINR